MKFDIVIIGSGPGGYVAGIRASQLGKSVAIIERSELGGICLNWGCIPTKALLKSAQVFDYINHAADYGITVSGQTVDFDGIVKRSRGVAGAMSKGVEFLMKKNKITVIKGAGKLAGKGKINVTHEGKTELVEADHIILATGARSRELPNIKIDGTHVIGYREAMVLPKQPKEMLVIGSGAIGMEFAYFYNSIGTKVTIVEFLPRILPVEDEDVSKTMAMYFKKKGIDILTDSSVEKVDIKGDRCHVSVKTKDGEKTFECDVVLSAAGVQTNLENLGLEEMGIKTDKGKVIVDEYYNTSVAGVYAIGDIVPGPALAHVASAEGIICVEK
ncbi:MAG: FAD-dependent oxidoreductase, partial [Bacteroidia bacterium]|nr:FAD-dependent oxidoreductase [Bacteroidia bacterium]